MKKETIKFKFNPPVDETMVLEEEFDEETRYDLQGKTDLLKNAVFFGMYIDNKLIGEWYGFMINQIPKTEENYCPGDHFPEFGIKHYPVDSTFYCYSNGLIKKYQNKRFGSILKSHMIGYLKAKGIKFIIGHAHENGSLQLNEKFACKKIHCFKNWYNTKHKYWLYEVIL